MLRSGLCHHSNACVVVKRTIDLLAAAANGNDKTQKNVAFKIILHLDQVLQKLTVN